MWIRLTSVQYVSDHGRQVKHFPGEWVEVGRQQAEAWMLSGDAERPDNPDLVRFTGCGAVISHSEPKARSILPKLDIELGDPPKLSFHKTLVWNPDSGLRPEFLSYGFNLLETWEAAIPIISYTELARDIGTDEDRAATEAIIHDLRVPVYSPDILFIRQCRNGRLLLEEWEQEKQTRGDPGLALLRAIYQVKPLILALPIHWI